MEESKHKRLIPIKKNRLFFMKFQMLSTVESRGKDKLEWREKEDYAGEYL
jgi:hypothetical protein